MTVVFSHTSSAHPTIDQRSARQAISAAARVARIRSGYCEVVFATDRIMRTLNRAHRGIHRTTDILSFPGAKAAKSQQQFIGELYLNVDDVRRRKKAEAISQKDISAFLLVHGFLHCVGFDHDTQARQRVMRNAERKICKEKVYYDHQ